MDQKDLMIDIETLATTPDAAVVTIGACMFALDGGAEQPITERKLLQASIASNETWGRRIAGDTLEWWFKQDPAALRGLIEGQVTNLKNALTQLRLWADSETTYRPARIWANDPDFDLVILQSAFRTCDVQWPWHFSIHRSMRTAGEFAYPNDRERKAVIKAIRDEVGTHHRADDDAEAQARFIAHCYEVLQP